MDQCAEQRFTKHYMPGVVSGANQAIQSWVSPGLGFPRLRRVHEARDDCDHVVPSNIVHDPTDCSRVYNSLNVLRILVVRG